MIFYVDGSTSITSSDAFNGPVIHTSNGYYKLDNNELVELDDPTKKCSTNRWVNIKGKAYQLRHSGPAYKFSHVEQGSISLVDESGQNLDASPEVLHLIDRAAPSRKFKSIVIGHIRDYKDAVGQSFFVADIDTNEFSYREGLSLQKELLLSDGIYGYNRRSKGLTKLDYKLDDIWTFNPGTKCLAPMQVMPHKKTILYYHGFARSEVLEDIPIPDEENLVPDGETLVYKHAVRRDGELYGLDRENGEKRWERVFSYGLNDMVLYDDKLYCVAENQLFRISPDTGEIKHQVQMEYSAGGDTELSNVLTVIDNKLWIQTNHWFYKTHCLLVVNLDTFAIEHKIDIPAPYQPKKFLYYDEKRRQVYYRLHFRHAEIRVEHNHPLLVLSLDELDEPLTFEPRPKIDISFKPADDNKDLEELWIHIKDTPLHKAIRFGIIETQNQTNVHAEMNRYGEGCRKTFNGHVHFRYSGSDKSKEEVEERLQIVEKSFNDWAQIMGVEAGTGSGEPVRIDFAYID